MNIIIMIIIVTHTARNGLALDLLCVDSGSLGSNRIVTDLAEVQQHGTVGNGRNDLGERHCRVSVRDSERTGRTDSWQCGQPRCTW
jgi:hypothetical protein